LDEVDSTQEEARRRLRGGDGDTLLVAAQHQLAGRGRHGARWVDEPGKCLLMTAILRGVPCPVSEVGLRSGAAVAETISRLCRVQIGLRWPNDLIARGGKLGGVLVEIESAEPIALVGVGVNLEAALNPTGGAPGATSVAQEGGRAPAAHRLLRPVYDAILRAMTAPLSEAIAAWRTRDASTSRRYAAQTSAGSVVGVAVGIDDAGKLLMELDDGSRIAVVSATHHVCAPD
jgi:BirA family biotin operon repressor/biotin-[acetyl-CoA-carboxylase] ligase